MREWRTIERAIEKQRKKNDWYNAQGNDVVIFLLSTPRSELQRRYTTEIKGSGLKIRGIKKAGISLKRLLQGSISF